MSFVCVCCFADVIFSDGLSVLLFYIIRALFSPKPDNFWVHDYHLLKLNGDGNHSLLQPTDFTKLYQLPR